MLLLPGTVRMWGPAALQERHERLKPGLSREDKNMRIKTAEVYICLEPCCRAEIVVRRGADLACPGKYAIRCCCGKEMVSEDKLAYAEPKRQAKRA